jgi:hypothetical protein
MPVAITLSAMLLTKRVTSLLYPFHVSGGALGVILLRLLMLLSESAMASVAV